MYIHVLGCWLRRCVIHRPQSRILPKAIKDNRCLVFLKIFTHMHTYIEALQNWQAVVVNYAVTIQACIHSWEVRYSKEFMLIIPTIRCKVVEQNAITSQWNPFDRVKSYFKHIWNEKQKAICINIFVFYTANRFRWWYKREIRRHLPVYRCIQISEYIFVG